MSAARTTGSTSPPTLSQTLAVLAAFVLAAATTGFVLARRA
ncbi:hypothetical protein [Micromonospora sp. WMMD1082]|nr:hypothetical protein [Micromonospora sp. WMMD1082]MDG4798356.1 hypothetical protein [Micromonospora sp. WMMD1082]